MRRYVLFALLLCTPLLLAACGQKGALYLPTRPATGAAPAHAATAAAPAPASTAPAPANHR